MAGESDAAKPRVQAKTTTWDFGEITEGFVARGELKLENRGDAPLRILNIRSACAACAAAAASDEPIPPGGSVKIRLQFNSAGSVGRQSKVVYVHTNDPKTPFVQLKIVGTVKRDPNRPIIELSADSWDAGLIYAGQAVETEFKIRNEGKRELEILGVYALAPVSVSCQKRKLAAGEDTKLTVRIEPKDFRGIVNERVVINTNDAVTPSRTVQVTGYVAKEARPTGKIKGAVVILPRDPVRLPGTNRRFFRKYEIANYTGSPVVLRCLSRPGHTRVDVQEVLIASGASRGLRAVPGEKPAEVDRLTLSIGLETFPLHQ
ncbi:MAG: hypothetical protein AMS16_00150 [Planctomycetes bacterium DG_58]|nr:MAG: hypothetical protein AMS16_00150 [Planctomycetes bacterium DG_58]